MGRPLPILVALVVVFSVSTPLAFAQTSPTEPRGVARDAPAALTGGSVVAGVETEPNDDFSQAGFLSPDDPVSGLLTEDDVDVFGFDGTAGERVTVTLTRSSEDGAVGVVLYDPDERQLTLEFVGTTTPATVSVVPSVSGVHFVQLVAVGGATGGYVLAVDGAVGPPGDDANEPNDDASQATSLARGTSVDGAVGDASDVDWFSLTSDGSFLELVVTRPATGTGTFAVVVYDADGRAISETFPLAVDDSVVLSGTVPLGSYLLTVESLDGGTGPYAVTYVGDDDSDDGDGGVGDDVNEPNDDPSSAAPLLLDVPVSGTVNSESDQDWFRFRTDGTEIGLVVERPAEGSGVLAVQLHDLTGGLLTEQFTVGVGSELVLGGVLAPGDYLLSVQSLDGGVGPYTVSYTAEGDGPVPNPGADANEPNDDVSQATTIDPGQTVSGVVDPASDVDWYTYFSSGSVRFDVVRTGGGSGTLGVQFFTADGQPVTDEFTLSVDEGGSIGGSPPAGVYTIRVRSVDGGTGPYQLTYGTGPASTTENRYVLFGPIGQYVRLVIEAPPDETIVGPTDGRLASERLTEVV